ncbi:hypothetical protein ACLOJK_036250 [Asimina triloba]
MAGSWRRASEAVCVAVAADLAGRASRHASWATSDGGRTGGSKRCGRDDLRRPVCVVQTVLGPARSVGHDGRPRSADGGLPGDENKDRGIRLKMDGEMGSRRKRLVPLL